jgi:hypothetical protein
MNEFQTQVRSDMRTEKEVAAERSVTVTLSITPDVAYQLAQFCKRSQFSQFYELTEAHLSIDERQQRAYQMIAGVEAVQAALAKEGFEPR